MERVALALVAGLLGGVGGSLAVHYLTAPPSEVRPTSDTDARLDRLRDAIAELRGKAGPEPATATPPPARLETGGGSPTPGPLLSPGAAPAAATPPAIPPEVEALLARAAERAAESALEKQAAKAEAEKPKPKKPMALAEVAHEMGLTAAQETEIREAYREATDRALKLMTEPDGDPEALRKELTEAKGNQAKTTALTMKYMPKFLGRIGDFMAVQADRDARIHKALGSDEAVERYQGYAVQEEDPFGFGGSRVSVGRGAR